MKGRKDVPRFAVTSVLALSLMLTLALIMVAGITPARASLVDPVFVDGNPTCGELAPGTT